jgi:hypothetical protein
VAKKEYVCVDNTPTLATWNETSGGGGASSVLETPITEETVLGTEAYGGRYVVSGLTADYNIYLPHADDAKVGVPVRFRVKSEDYADKEYTLLAQDATATFELVASGHAFSKIVADGTTLYAITTTGVLYTSIDGGIVWTVVTLPVTTGSTVKDIAASSTCIVVVVDDASTGLGSCVSTNHGSSWTLYDQTDWTTADYISVAYVNSLFIVMYGMVAIDYTVDDAYVATSAAGATWTAHVAPEVYLRHIAYNSGTYVVTMRNPDDDTYNIIRSTDLDTWNNSASSLTLNWQDVIYADSKFVAVGYSTTFAVISTSTDGTTWSDTTLTTGPQLYAVLHTGTAFYAFGNGTTYLYSTDGATWLSSNNVADGSWRSAVLTNGKLVVVSHSPAMVQAALIEEDVSALPVLVADMEVVIYWSGLSWEVSEYITQSGVPPHIATVDPTVDDDDVAGYVVGQVWVNSTSEEAFIAVNVDTGAAVWTSITAAGGGGTDSRVDDITLDTVTDRTISAYLNENVSKQLIRGIVYTGVDASGTVADPGTTMQVVTREFITYSQGTTNQALNKTATAESSYGSPYDPPAAVDGIDDASSDNRWSSNITSTPQWFKIDLGSGNARMITKLQLYRSQYDGARVIVVSGSNDDSSYTTLYTSANMGSVSGVVEMEEFTWTNTTTYRYIKITTTTVDTNPPSWCEVKLYEDITVTNGVVTTTTQTLPDEAVTAVVALVAKIGSYTLNSTMVASVSNNAGTNYDTITLTDRGQVLPLPTGYKLYTGVVTLTDRDGVAMRFKLQLTGSTAFYLKSFAVQYLK